MINAIPTVTSNTPATKKQPKKLNNVGMKHMDQIRPKSVNSESLRAEYEAHWNTSTGKVNQEMNTEFDNTGNDPDLGYPALSVSEWNGIKNKLESEME